MHSGRPTFNCGLVPEGSPVTRCAANLAARGGVVIGA
jgi:hypothetical protein